jgi:hypothetical protein
MIQDWIFKDNALPFFEMLAIIIGYEFDEDDWVALEYGLQSSDTDANPEQWFDYQFGNTKFSVGIDSGTDVLRLRIEVDEKHVEAIQATVNVMNRYKASKF